MKSETVTKYVIKRGKSYASSNKYIGFLAKNLSEAHFYDSENAALDEIMKSKREIAVPVKITYKEDKI